MTHIIGIIKPSNRPTKAEELVAILPPGEIEILHDNLEIYNGTKEEIREAVEQYGPKVANMAKQGAELIHPAGAPPLLLGYAGEREMVERWEDKYGVPVFTNGQSQVNALRALGARSIVGCSYIRGDINQRFGEYYREAGFKVHDMVGMDVDFQAVPQLPREDVYAFVKGQFLTHPSAEAIYLLGPAWKASMELIDVFEKELGVPVVHHVPAQSWEIQRRFGLRHPVQGYGRLVAELPPLAG